MSNNLGLDQVAANQNQKEVTINDQAGQLDAALTENLAVDMSAGDVTLTSLEFRRNVCFVCSGQAASQDLNIPAVERGLFCVQNSDATYDVVVVKGSTEITLAPTEAGLFKTDGTTNDLVLLGKVSAVSNPVDVAIFIGGMPGNDEIVLRIPFNRTVVFPSGLGDSNASAETASTGTAVFDIQKNGGSVGSITFTSSDTGVFAMASDTTFDPGDYMMIIAPSTQDATLSDIGINIAGAR